VIKSFRNKALADHFAAGKAAKIDARLHKRITVRLDVLNDAKSIEDLNLPGYNFHALKGFRPTQYTIHVNGPWCITFEFAGENAYHVDFEQYH
jgi:proteic killer suppression protein